MRSLRLNNLADEAKATLRAAAKPSLTLEL